MTLDELIDELMDLSRKHSDCEVYIDGYEILSVEYNEDEDCIDING